MARTFALLVIAAIAALGCEPSTETAQTEAPKTTVAGAGATKTPPMMEIKEDPNETKAIAGLRDAYAKSKAAYEKSKADAKAKEAYVASTVKLATTVMNANSLAPKEKYPEALRLYREALAIDPKNAEAQENKEMIETIYKGMGRPIPQ
jgi:hypothetical protein